MSKHKVPVFVAAGVALLLSACVGDSFSRANKATPPQKDVFAGALFNGYMGLAAAERQEADYKDSEVFAARALAISSGQAVEPEAIGARRLPDSKVMELTEARAKMMDLFEKGARLEVPVAAADTQVAFDCWMQEQEENVQPADIAACREAFFAGLDNIGHYYASRVITPTTFTVYFDSGRSNIDDKDLASLGLATAMLEKFPNAKAAVSGHTDSVGNPKANLQLSQDRTENVLKTLQSLGVAAERMSAQSDGEDKPAVKTADNVDEQANRRVEIHLYQ